METYNLSTSQNVTLEYRIASIGDRIFAYLIDLLVVSIYSIGVIFSVSRFWGDMTPWHSILFLPVIFYHLLWEILMNGQSPGKLLMRIKVVKSDGTQLSVGTCFLRWIFRFIDILLAGGSIATLTLIINGKGQRLGDIAASTTVLKIPKKEGLHATSWMAIEADYEPVFVQAELLNDKDIHTIREVLAYANSKPDSHKRVEILKKTRDAVTKKASIQSDMTDLQFLSTIVKDYNAIHQYMMAN
jgi:uncharacterized RDD family membrane protein YckC